MEFPSNSLGKKIKETARIGLAALAFYGVAGNFEQAKGIAGNIEETGRSSGTPKQSGEREMDEVEVERVRADLIRHVSSQEYLDKLQIEFGGDAKQAKSMQEIRLLLLKTFSIRFVEKEDLARLWAEHIPDGVSEKGDSESLSIRSKLVKAGLSGINAFCDVKGKIIFLSDPKFAEHELLHASTLNDIFIMPGTKKLLEESYIKTGDYADNYLNLPTERLARKHILDFEMKKLGIKNYGENFTDEHLEQLLDYYNKGKLSREAGEFVRTTKKEDFKKIFNEIAVNESVDSNPVKHV